MSRGRISINPIGTSNTRSLETNISSCHEHVCDHLGRFFEQFNRTVNDGLPLSWNSIEKDSMQILELLLYRETSTLRETMCLSIRGMTGNHEINTFSRFVSIKKYYFSRGFFKTARPFKATTQLQFLLRMIFFSFKALSHYRTLSCDWHTPAIAKTVQPIEW